MNRLGWAGAGLWDVGGWSRLAGLGLGLGWGGGGGGGGGSKGLEGVLRSFKEFYGGLRSFNVF